jgi:hypothetical protein
MKIIYTPEGEPPREYIYSPGRIRTAQAEMLEKRTGMTWGDFNQALARGSVLARRALLWHFERQTHPTLRFEDVDFALDELEVRFDKSEYLGIREQMETAPLPPGTPDEVRDMILAEVDKQIDEADESPGKAS